MGIVDLRHTGIAFARRLAAAAAMTLIISAPAAMAGQKPASLVGAYQGGQMEIAAALELTAKGRFRYELSYGSLDEAAEGKWTANGDQVTLTSDPAPAPQYVVVSQANGPQGVLRIIMDFKDSYYQQHFFALVTRNDGSVDAVQLGIDGLSWAFTPDAPPKSVRLLFNVYQLASDPLPLAPGPGYLIHYRFDANGLGKVAFKGEPLKIDHGELVLERHGRTLRFRRVKS